MAHNDDKPDWRFHVGEYYGPGELTKRGDPHNPDITVGEYLRAEIRLRRNCMGLHSLIANGGRVVVVGGRMNEKWAEFAKNPQFVFWTGDPSEIERNFTSHDSLPVNTHGVILSWKLGHAQLRKVMEEARRKRMLIMGPCNEGEVVRYLEQISNPEPPKVEPPKAEIPPSEEQQPKEEEMAKSLRRLEHGELSDWVTKHDVVSKTITESGKAIYEKMTAAGIKTTAASVIQSVSKMRKDAGVVSSRKTTPRVPKVAKTAAATETETEVLLKMIDDLMTGFTLLKDAVRSMHEHDKQYRQLEATLAQLGFQKK